MRAGSEGARPRLAMLVLALVACGTVVAPAEAQVAVGDSLWRLGRTDEAAIAYRKALEEDRNAVRANFRLSQTLAWSSNIDSALVLLRAARVRVPDDPDLLFTEATYLAWGRRWPEALLRYDSLITAHPTNDYNYVRVARARTLSWSGRLTDAQREYREVLAREPGERDARFGLGQVSAWSGDLDAAATQYAALLVDDPDEGRVLLALAQVRLWQSKYASAAKLAARAAVRDSANGDLRELQRALAAASALRVDVGQSWSEDSDRNVNFWQTVGARTVVGDGLRLGASLGFLSATDPTRTSRRSMAEFSLGMPFGKGTVAAAVGARALDPAPLTSTGPAAPSRAVLTGRLSLQQRVGAGVTLGASVARWPFDEIAVLMPLALDVDQWEGTAEWRATPKLGWNAMVGGLDFSDGNRRRAWSGRAAYRLAKGLTVGALASGFAYERRELRYFSPPRFTAGEATAGWARETATWSAALSGGLGLQQIDTLASQDQWHLDGRLARQWGRTWALELVGGRSTSAAASAVGAYAYTTLGLTLRRAF